MTTVPSPMKFRIVPTSREFFNDFSLAAQNLSECVDRFKDVLADTSEASERHVAVKEVERTGDEYTSRILTRLDSTFVTPFDPEDIQGWPKGSMTSSTTSTTSRRWWCSPTSRI